jgi:hypothetical protein
MMRSPGKVAPVAVALVLVLGAGLTGCTPPPGPTADYRFQDSLATSVGSAPDLLMYSGSPVYKTETVNGSARRVLTFAAGNGPILAPSYPTAKFEVYSMAVRFRFADVSGYRRVFDVKGSFVESGLYIRDGALAFYPKAQGTATPVKANQYVQVVLTRTTAGWVTGYVTGTQQFQFPDRAGDAMIDSDLFFGIRLIWFIDNKEGGSAHNEESSGAVARIRLWDRALSANEVAELGR